MMDLSPSKSASRENGMWLVMSGIVVAVLTAQAIQLNNGAFHPLGLAYIGLAIFVSFLGVWWSEIGPQGLTEKAIRTILGVFLAVQFIQLQSHSPGVYLSATSNQYLQFAGGLVLAAFVAGSGLAGKAPLSWIHMPLLGTVFILLGWWVIFFSPEPRIDVYFFQTHSSEALLSGLNPYALRFKNIYSHESFYGLGVVKDGVLQFGYPYFPLSFIMAVPGWLLGDIRLISLLAIVGSGFIFHFLQPGPIGRGLAALYWFSPRTFFVIEQSWTEPLIVFLATVFALLIRKAPRLSGFAAGLLLASKQTMIWMLFLLLPLLPKEKHSMIRQILTAILTACTITMPFLLWNPVEFCRSVVLWQFIQPFRPDALSFPALIYQLWGTVTPWQVAFMGGVGMSGFSLWRASRTLAGWGIATCLVYLVFFSLSKQAFCNYYFFVIGMACLAAAAANIPHAKDDPIRSMTSI